ncbi:amino acid ABC transporter glutamin-binding protein [Corynebacterium suranareeae]|uniref:Amino acid ABC transporter glutamin-binding protein n=1 Tax=Corynebacterium suranareeae TaxID=2506452 RepID=A0A169S3W0_9CORY|nr:glutamate ABC transporter substrate-binding protein [Corynebacterium suranareeae]BAU97108.1 amino acid ABC transporter glutamin-binding protein [Corynebacterium suranareeae]
MLAFRRPLLRITHLGAALLAATLLVSCTPAPVEQADTLTALDPDAGPPLPPDSSLEAPGEKDPVVETKENWPGSLRPDDKTPEERVPSIVNRGRIIVGVDQSQNLLSFRDPVTGELRGFEIELAREISRDIFGDPNRVDFRFVGSADRLRSLDQGDVDIVIRSVAITDERAKLVEFSTPYLQTQTRMLTMESSGISSIADLPGHTICVTEGSTSLQRARTIAPESSILRTRNWSDCLMALQQHQAQVILGDDVILSGIAAQDPYTEILDTALDSQFYGVAATSTTAGTDSSGLIRQVNSTIERIREDRTWWTMFNDWFGPYLWSYGPPQLQYMPEEEGADNNEGQ